jgi:hypothetical protein
MREEGRPREPLLLNSPPALRAHLTYTKATTVPVPLGVDVAARICPCRRAEEDLLERDAATRELADLRAVDVAVNRYHRRLDGREPWPTFEVPASVKEAA